MAQDLSPYYSNLLDKISSLIRVSEKIDSYMKVGNMFADSHRQDIMDIIGKEIDDIVFEIKSGMKAQG